MIDLLEDDHYEVIRRHFEFRGVPLYAMGFWNLLGSVLSHMAVMKLRDWGSFYHLLPENPNAAEWIIFWLRAIKSSDSLVGIRGGMDWIVARLCQELGLVVAKADDAGLLEPNERGELRYTEGGPHCDLRLRHKLKEVREDANGVTLVFKNGEKEIVEVKKLDHVILAMPKAPLQKIHYQGKAEMVSEFCQDLDSVFAFPLLKCFFVIDKPFWEDNRKPNTYAAHVPTRELHWWKSRDKTLGMSMLYTDRPGTQFWADYLTDQHLADKNRKQIQAKVWRWSTNEVDSKYLRKGDKFENERLLRTFLLYAREKSSEYVTASRLIAAGMRDWGLMPYGGACHAWRSGSQSWEVRKRLKCFSLWDKSRGSIHVCGEAYSDYQGFIEGSLRSARDILVLDNEPFNISDEDLLPTGYNDRALPRSRRPSQR